MGQIEKSPLPPAALSSTLVPMNERDPNATAEKEAAGPRDRVDDYFGPPVTAAEVALLEKLTEIGGEKALAADARAKAKRLEAEWADAATAKALVREAREADKTFDHMSRMVRLTLGLKSKLVMDLEAWRRRGARTAAEQQKDAERERRDDLKRQVGAILDEVVGKAHGAQAAASVVRPLNRWFAERDHERGLPDRPLGVIAELIAREIGYKIDWSEWQDRPWAADAAAAAPPEPEPQITEIELVIVDAAPAGHEPIVIPPDQLAEWNAKEKAGQTGTDPPPWFAHLDRSRPEVREFLAERGYRTD